MLLPIRSMLPICINAAAKESVYQLSLAYKMAPNFDMAHLVTWIYTRIISRLDYYNALYISTHKINLETPSGSRMLQLSY